MTHSFAFSSPHAIALPRVLASLAVRACAWAITCASTAASAATAIPLDGFETPVLPSRGHSFAPTGSAWTFGGASTSGIQRNGSSVSGASAPEGLQTAFVRDSGGRISTNATLPAGTYSISFMGARGLGQWVANAVQVRVDGLAVSAAIRPQATSFNPYQSNVFTIPSSGSHKIEIAVSGSQMRSSPTLIDKVVINQLSVAGATLSVTKTGAGEVKSAPAGIDCGSVCSASYAAGAMVALTAQPAPGYIFNGWSGACSGVAACKVTMASAASVSADFKPVLVAAGDYLP